MPKGGTFNWAATVPVGGPYTTVPCASVPFGLPTRRNAPVPRSPTGKPNAVPSVSDDGGTAMISFFCLSAAVDSTCALAVLTITNALGTVVRANNSGEVAKLFAFMSASKTPLDDGKILKLT